MHFFGRQATQTWIFSSFGQSERTLILDRLGAISPSWVREQIISQIRQPVHSLFWSFNIAPSRCEGFINRVRHEASCPRGEPPTRWPSLETVRRLTDRNLTC